MLDMCQGCFNATILFNWMVFELVESTTRKSFSRFEKGQLDMNYPPLAGRSSDFNTDRLSVLIYDDPR